MNKGEIAGALLVDSSKAIECNQYDFTIHISFATITDVISKLENDEGLLIKWFKDNGIKPNEDKCKLIVLSNRDI